MQSRWYALRSKPNREELIFDQLSLRGIDTFYPRIRVKEVNPRARRIRPFFPSYLFLRLDLSRIGESALQWIPGTTGSVSFGGKPASVPDSLIHAIQRRVGEIDAAGEEILKTFKPGDPVFIQDGPLKGDEQHINSLLEVGTGFNTELSDRENIYLNGSFLGMKTSEIRRKFEEIAAFSEIDQFIDTPVKYYSSGMFVRLAFSVAAQSTPEILSRSCGMEIPRSLPRIIQKEVNAGLAAQFLGVALPGLARRLPSRSGGRRGGAWVPRGLPRGRSFRMDPLKGTIRLKSCLAAAPRSFFSRIAEPRSRKYANGPSGFPMGKIKSMGREGVSWMHICNPYPSAAANSGLL